jgi:methionyl-tRNA synthetase
VSGGERYYITTAIDYANGPPHMGHALEKVGADALARYRRLKGDRVRLVIGMDEHGQNVLQSAEAAGITPTEWVDRLAVRFQETWRSLGIGYDDFIRTTEPRHHRAVAEMIHRMQRAGDLYQGTYAGYYCVRCEAYKTEEELVAAEAAEADGEAAAAGGDAERWRCPLHPNHPIQWMEEDNWFFRLSAYQDRLLRLLDERPEFIQPEIRRNEIRRVIEGGLEDISVSRSRLPWGVPWPDDSEHTVYVWIDALTNYLSAIGFPGAEHGEWWPAALHVIGKDITRFHCIYWPAMLLSAELELPETVWAHGFLTYEGRRFSKSAGAWVELDDAIARHGPEALRYYLLREVPWNGDGDFSWSRFDARYTADLADNLGNLVNRSLSMIERYRGGVVPEGAETTLDRRLTETLVRYRGAMDNKLLHQGAAAALELADAANAFIVEQAPWKQAKEADRAGELDATLGSLARALAALATLLSPYLPETMTLLARRLGLESLPALDDIAGLDLAGRPIERGDVLFPKPEK